MQTLENAIFGNSRAITLPIAVRYETLSHFFNSSYTVELLQCERR